MGKRVLVADDSATIQKAFAMVFGGQDVSLIAARSMDEAISAARQGRPDLVIADTNLAGRTGYELCAAVKADPGLRGVPVYILASTHTPYDEPKGREAGADGHLQKPFESQGIIDKVNEILARAAAAASVPAKAPAAHVVPGPPAAPARAAAPITASVSPAGARARQDHFPIDDDDYGEVTIERTPLVVPQVAAAPTRPVPAPAAAVSSAAAMAAPAPAGAPGFSGLRPSLIPGARPGLPTRPAAASTLAASTLAGGPPLSAPGASAGGGYGLRPGTSPAPGASSPASSSSGPAAPSGAGSSLAPGSPFAAEPAPSAPAAVGRTMMGMPAVVIPGVPRAGAPAQPASALPSPGMAPAPKGPAFSPGSPPAAAPPALSFVPAPSPAPAATAVASAAGAAISARVEQKLGAFAARGPEYEAIARLSREVIEEIVWEVVPELAEIIIREHVERLGIAKKLG